jgi:hypothetical protein
MSMAESTRELYDLISYVNAANAATEDGLSDYEELDDTTHATDAAAQEKEMQQQQEEDIEDQRQLVLSLFPPEDSSALDYVDVDEQLRSLQHRHANLLKFTRNLQMAREAERRAFQEELRTRTNAMQDSHLQGQHNLRQLVQTYSSAEGGRREHEQMGSQVLAYLFNHKDLLTDVHKDLQATPPASSSSSSSSSPPSSSSLPGDRKEIHRLRDALERSLVKQKEGSAASAAREKALRRKLGISEKSLLVTLKRVEGLRAQAREKERALTAALSYSEKLEARLLAGAKKDLRLRHAAKVVRDNKQKQTHKQKQMRTQKEI